MSHLPRFSPSFCLTDAFKAIGDGLRFSIVRVMRQDSFGVLELCEIFDVRQPAMSHHLKVLVESGLLCSRREGNSLFYRRVSPQQGANAGALRAIFELIDSESVAGDLQQRLGALQAKRNDRSAQFFHRNAERFRDQQDLIAGYDDYGSAVVEAIGALGLSGCSWLEVGSGEGELLEDLAAEFSQVVALDVSSALLDAARKKLARFAHIQWVCSELKSANLGEPVDLVTCNMVLHHVASPADLMADMANQLKTGGYLLMTDLCSHDQEWARESCGDFWLGLERDDLVESAARVGLVSQSEQFLALRNGFRVQLIIFKSELTREN